LNDLKRLYGEEQRGIPRYLNETAASRVRGQRVSVPSKVVLSVRAS
jgi:hypothetical protein